MKKIYVPLYEKHAGKWIYDGYSKAWEYLGFEVERYQSLVLDTCEKNSYLMVSSETLSDGQAADLEQVFSKVFVFCAMNDFVFPYCNHKNFVPNSSKNSNLINYINSFSNIVKFSFLDTSKGTWWDKWGQVNYVPLAFDHLSYKPETRFEFKYDVCFIGGVANNGFNTKIKIMESIFKRFMASNLKCGFFLEKGLTHEQEMSVMANSRVCLNIHDEYQRIVGLDVNERTFKALGLSGVMVSDYVQAGVDLFGDKWFSQDENIVDKVILLKDTSISDRLLQIENILENHTYVSRCKTLLDL